MAVNSFTPKLGGQDWVNKSFTAPPNLTPGVRVALASSDLVSNNNGQRGLNVNAEFSALSPNVPGASFELMLVVEGKDASGNWYDVGYQFSPFKYMGIAPKRRISVDPTVDTFNDGIDSTVYVANAESSRVSRQRGFIPPDGFRVCLYLVEYNPGGPNCFQSVTCSLSGEKYDV